MSIAPIENAIHDLIDIARKGITAAARVVLWALEDEDTEEVES